MKVIICGAGQVGWQIARHLSGEQNNVTVVDNNPDLVRRATESLNAGMRSLNGSMRSLNNGMRSLNLTTVCFRNVSRMFWGCF